MPLLFSLAIHDVPCEVSGQLQEGELLFAYMDDVHVVSKPDRTRFLFDLLANRLHALAGIELHEGKTHVWNQAGECPFGMAALGDGVWSPHGVKILGTPVGSYEFVEAKIEARLADEKLLWEAISWVPDLQCAWQILLQCAGPRCHHLLRTVPPNATSRVSRLERCIAQLSPDDSTELRALQAALEKARAQTVLPHPAKQVEDCQQCCSRAKRRLEKA